LFVRFGFDSYISLPLTGHADVVKYRKECSERQRKSLEYRGKEKRVHRLLAETTQQKEQQKDHDGFMLESLARKDIEDYIKDCKKRRRKSLAQRAQLKRKHASWKRRQKEIELEERQKTSHFHSLDAQNVALAKQEERARIALDALRSAGCSIQGNPFSSLLR